MPDQVRHDDSKIFYEIVNIQFPLTYVSAFHIPDSTFNSLCPTGLKKTLALMDHFPESISLIFILFQYGIWFDKDTLTY